MPDIRLLITADAAGGVWTYALEMARALSAYDVATTLAVLGNAPSESELSQARSISGLDIELTNLPLDWTAANASEVADAGDKIADLARRLNVDLVQLNAPALAASAAFPVPTIGVLHSCVATWWEAVHGNVALPPDLAWRAKLTRAGLSRVDVAVAPSQALARQAQRIYALPHMPIVIHNGRSKPGLARHGARDIPVLTAGRLWDEGKNVAALDRAAEHLPFKICAAGPLTGPNGASVEFDRLDWLGILDAAGLQDMMARTAVFVSPALYEPFGLAVLEAAQAGCALVLSDIPTFRELWDGAALFVSADDDAAIAAAIRDLVADPRRRARLGGPARARSEIYTVESTAQGMMAIYEAVLARQAALRHEAVA